MPGQPKKAALIRRIEDAGGFEEVVFSRIRGGDYLSKIAKELDVSRGLLWDAIRRDDARRQAYEDAKLESADAHVEKAGEVLDDLDDIRDPTSAQVSRAKAQADHRKWLAAKRDRTQYGDDPLVAVGALDLGQLFLHALQEGGSARQLTAADTEEIPEADFDEVEE